LIFMVTKTFLVAKIFLIIEFLLISLFFLVIDLLLVAKFFPHGHDFFEVHELYVLVVTIFF
jgi:hypothetical protein